MLCVGEVKRMIRCSEHCHLLAAVIEVNEYVVCW